MPPTLFYMLRITLAVYSLWLHMNFKFFFSISVKAIFGILKELTLNL